MGHNVILTRPSELLHGEIQREEARLPLHTKVFLIENTLGTLQIYPEYL